MQEEAVLEPEEEIIQERATLRTHTNIFKNQAYTVKEHTVNSVILSLETTQCEHVDESGNVYDGALLSAATFAAHAVVNDAKSFLIGLHLDLLEPIKDDGILLFHARSKATSSGKKLVHVTGKINDIEFLEGDFMLLKLDEKSLIK